MLFGVYITTVCSKQNTFCDIPYDCLSHDVNSGNTCLSLYDSYSQGTKKKRKKKKKLS